MSSSAAAPTKKEEKQETAPQDDWRNKQYLCPRLKVHQKFKFHEVTLREFTSMDIEGAPIIQGFPSAGVTSSLCANYFVEKLNLPLIGDFVSAHFPTSAIVSNFVPASSARIYGNKSLVVIISELKFQESANDVVRSLSSAILDFAARHKASLLLTLEGQAEEDDEDIMIRSPEEDEMPNEDEIVSTLMEGLAVHHGKKKKKNGTEAETKAAEEKDKKASKKDKKDKDGKKKHKDEEEEAPETKKKEEPKEPESLEFFANDEAVAKKIIAMGHAPLESGTFEGITGELLTHAPFSDVKIVMICASFKKFESRAAVPCVRAANALLNVNVDLADLKQRTQELEDTVNNALSKITGPPRPTGQAANMYI